MEITFEELCALNGLSTSEDLHVLQKAQFPETEFSGDFTIVLYSIKGISDITIDGKDYTLRRKCISVLRPGQKIKFHPSEDLSYQMLLISGKLNQFMNVNSVFLTLFVTEEYPVIRITSSYNEAVRLFFESISIVNRFHDNPYKKDSQVSILKSLFYSTGYYVFKSLRIHDSLYKFASEYPENENTATSRFLSLVEKHSTRERRLSFYAALLDYNPKYLSAMIKRETGHSGQELIDQYSLLAAMAKLSYGHLSIKEISDEMNFQSQSDFGKFFKRLTGLSPLNYRKSRFKNID